MCDNDASIDGGLLKTCSSCKAVRYCSKDCQKDEWRDHKRVCLNIKKRIQETKTASEKLMACKLEDGTIVNLFETKIGDFAFGEDQKNDIQKYVLARTNLSYAFKILAIMDLENTVAYELAAKNMLDLMVLSYMDENLQRNLKPITLGFLIAGDMDQEAYNLIRYFQKRNQFKKATPYLLIEDQDIEEVVSFDKMCITDVVAISLLKYKRMKKLKDELSQLKNKWRAFRRGMHPVAGANSQVLKIRTLTPVVKKLKEFVFDKRPTRIVRLSKQVRMMLKCIEAQNEYVIPSILQQTVSGVHQNESQLEYWKRNSAADIAEYFSDGWMLASDGYEYLADRWLGYSNAI